MLKEGCIPVDRGSTTRAGLSKLIKRFKNRLENRNVIVFPEGTRTLPDAKPAYKSGLGTIVAGLDAAIVVPVAHNSGRIWPRRGYPSSPGLITVRIMPAINTKGLDRNEINARVEAAIEEGMKGL
jgi:1-acyl-sn-glycerol-3-phosphate acyltransferase